MRRFLPLLALAIAALGSGAATAAIQLRTPSAQDIAARHASEATPPLPAWLEHDYEALKVCRTHISWADRIGHPLIWSGTLPDHSDVAGFPAPRGPPELPWKFSNFFNRSAHRSNYERHHSAGSPGVACTPLTLYTPFCREYILWSGGTGTFAEPTLPGGTGACAGGALVSTFTPVAVASLSALHTQMGLGCKNIVLNAGLTLGSVQGGCVDCEITIPSTSSVSFWFPSVFGGGTGSTGRGYTTRMRIRGPGTVGGMQFLSNNAGTNSDVVVDGVQFDPTVSGSSQEPMIETAAQTDRLLFANSVLRAPLQTGAKGNVFLLSSVTDLGIFNCSTANDPGAGANNSWNARHVACTRVVEADNMMLKTAAGQQAVWRHGTGTNTGTILYHNTYVATGDGLVAKEEDSPYTNTETYGTGNTFIIAASLSNFLGRQDQGGSGGSCVGMNLTGSDWRATNSSYVTNPSLTSLENSGNNIHMTSGNTYTYNATFSALVPAWPTRTSPLTGASLDGDPSHLP